MMLYNRDSSCKNPISRFYDGLDAILSDPQKYRRTKRLVAPDVRTKNMWLEACCALLGKSLARPDPAEAEPERVPRLELSLPYDLQLQAHSIDISKGECLK